MKRHQKVAWIEGMFLKQHHFQQLERYHQAIAKRLFGSISRYGWGLSEIAIDRESLHNGQFSLSRCSGVTPDGLPFDMPDFHPLPNSQDFKDYFTPNKEVLDVFLAIPSEKEGGSNCWIGGSDDKVNTRFIFKNITLFDDNTGDNEQEIGIALPNFQLHFDDTRPKDFSSIKIAEILRKKDNFSLNNNFIPPCLHLTASERLLEIIDSLIGLLVQKYSSLRKYRRHTASGQIGFTTGDATILVLHTVNTFIPLLNHYRNLPKCHPEEFYTSLLTLGGQLATFSSEEITKLPYYDHDNIANCFSQLYVKLRTLLDRAVPPPPGTLIPLETQDGSIFVGKVKNESIFKEAQLFLALEVNENIPEKLVVNKMVNTKISSPKEIQILISSAQQGLPSVHTPNPPPGLPIRSGLLYFRIEKTGPLWESICSNREIAISFTEEFKDLKPKLVAIKKR